MRGVGAYDLHVFTHAKEQRVHGVATRREQAAAAGVLAGVPAVLSIPWANAVVIIHFTVMNLPEQPLIDDRFNGAKLTAEPALETDARFDFGGLDGFVNLLAILPIQSERFPQNPVPPPPAPQRSRVSHGPAGSCKWRQPGFRDRPASSQARCGTGSPRRAWRSPPPSPAFGR